MAPGKFATPQAVKDASIAFSPMPRDDDDREPGKPATGFSDNTGAYVLSTYKPLDGAQVGKHRVTITLDDTNPAGRICTRSKQIVLEVKPGENELNIELNQ